MLIHEHSGHFSIHTDRERVNLIVEDERSGVFAISFTCDPNRFSRSSLEPRSHRLQILDQRIGPCRI